jgi:hypothetical protein
MYSRTVKVGVPKKVVFTKISAHVSIKQVHCLNKIKYDFTKCGFALLHL